MPKQSAIEYADALVAVHEAETPEEKEAAVEVLLAAAEEYDRKRGVAHRSRLSGLLGIFLVIALIVIGLLVVENTNETTHIARSSARTAHETCERSNESRVAGIVEKRQAVRTLEKSVKVTRRTLHLWRVAIAEAPPAELAKNPLAPLLTSYVGGLSEELDGLTDELKAKREGIRATIEAQADVAIKPGSPIVDCEMAAPLP